ncbi:methyl-accepting chemotaxis protein [Polymorphum gilvum]|uniref:Methyl-accepting chemotaxis protein signaling domain n=1 Tax=Polymorphum gilvum (strain LMG 25793 / CGMCC 1.9160 / SL003B-26A1) TaxID=991905 RepID=F2IUW3_POLGS|nr:methyl-accepting chemotaxis protein [Polymorphum gilvum]ADZ70192.1 Methyl-accepting chemotaxis protein signaling domain [Polymorphum gilvum SL003B-26A1]
MKSADTAGPRKSRKLFRLSVNIPVLMVGLTLSACVAVGVIGYLNGRDGLQKAAEAELAMVVKAKQALVNARLTALRSDLSNIASSANAALAVTDLAGTLSNLDKERADILGYYSKEGSSASERAELTGSNHKTMYSWRHSEVHGSFATAWRHGGYADIYAITPDGFILYSVTKSGDFLKSVKDADIAGSALAKVFDMASTLPSGEQAVSDFSAYGPAGGAPSLFIAEPVHVKSFGDSKYSGVIVMRIETSLIDGIVGDREGMGETGQVYVAGPDGTIVSNLPLAGEPTALKRSTSAAPVTSALSGTAAAAVVKGEDGVDRLTVASPVSFMGQTWAIVAEKTVEETLASVIEMRNSMMLWTLITVAIAALIALLFSRSITRPLTTLVSALEAIAGGNLNTEISAAKRGDEIGDIGRAVLKIRENAAAEQEERAQEEARLARSQAEQRQEMLSGLASEFEASVGNVVEAVSRSVATLQEAATEMQHMTVSAGDSASRAAEISNQAMEEVQSIATASDQLSSSIQQISELIARSSSVAQTATIRAQATNSTVRSLAEAANRIGEVVTLISDIADQTNLLALNATIEAARAGEAGRGFAVVASEVKELASQTGKATEEIQQQIDAIRSATEDAVGAIAEIQETINEITMSVTEVSSAVEEQSAATRGIADNTQRAARGTAEVSSDIRNVNDVTERTSKAAEGFVASADDLSRQASHLDEEVRAFLAQVRSA